jgi:4-azaleucine resistance transporter AzlC
MTMTSATEEVSARPGLLPARMTRKGIARGIRLGAPFALSGVPWGLAFGVLSRDVDLSSVQTMFMSLFVYSGTGQMVAVDLWRSDGGTLAIWLSMLLVSLRYIMFGLVMRPWFHEIAPYKAYATLYFLADQSWALMAAEHRAGRRDVGILVGCNLVMVVGWVGGTAVGRFAGSAIPDPERFGLGFLATSALVSLLAGMWQGRSALLPWTAAAVASVAANQFLPGHYYILIGALLGTMVAVAQERMSARG